MTWLMTELGFTRFTTMCFVQLWEVLVVGRKFLGHFWWEVMGKRLRLVVASGSPLARILGGWMFCKKSDAMMVHAWFFFRKWSLCNWNPNDLYFWRSTPQNKAFSNQNKVHLGSRYVDVHTFAMKIIASLLHLDTLFGRICLPAIDSI